MNEKKTKPQLWEEIRKYEQLQLWTEQFLEERGLLQEYNGVWIRAMVPVNTIPPDRNQKAHKQQSADIPRCVPGFL